MCIVVLFEVQYITRDSSLFESLSLPGSPCSCVGVPAESILPEILLPPDSVVLTGQ